MIEIIGTLKIPEDEVSFTFSRSSGPGGQNVNKVNSRVTLWFDVDGSPSLSNIQKNRIRQKLANRINNDGVLQVVSMRYRTQRGNREDALQRFAALLANAITVDPVRKKTKIPRGVRKKRLQMKKLRSKLKAVRAKKEWT